MSSYLSGPAHQRGCSVRAKMKFSLGLLVLFLGATLVAAEQDYEGYVLDLPGPIKDIRQGLDIKMYI